MQTFSALDRQKHIYTTGISGKKPLVPIDPDKMAKRAKEKMSRKGFAYLAGGAGIEHSIRNNRNGFNKWQIRPHMLRDVSVSDTTIDLFGRKIPSPLLLSPVGVLEIVHKEADLAVAKAAASMGLPYIFSNQASVPMEKAAGAMGDAPRWFQLYWSKSNELVESLISRAEACGCEAIVVTLDTTMLGWRIQDLDLAFLPFLQGKGIAQYTSDPIFQRLMDEPDDPGLALPKPKLTWTTLSSVWQMMRNYPDRFFTNLRSGRPMKAIRKFVNLYTNPALNWTDLAFLRERTKLPILLKGILRADDALKALDHGIDGLIVSNHGGRQVDGSISTIEALPDIVVAVGGQIPVLIDSGIRGGADMFKAIALGATAVCIGRPYAYGLAIAGEAGVKEVLGNYLADFELTMRLSGCKSIAEITTDLLITKS